MMRWSVSTAPEMGVVFAILWDMFLLNILHENVSIVKVLDAFIVAIQDGVT